MAARKPKAPEKIPVDQIAKEIAIGWHDSEIADIFTTLRARATENNWSIKWRIDLDDLHVTQDDLTLGEACRLEDESGANWATMPPPLSSAAMARRVLVMLFETRLHLDAGAAVARADSMSIPAIEAAYSSFVDDIPKA